MSTKPMSERVMVDREALDSLIDDVRQVANVVGDSMVYARLMKKCIAVEKSLGGKGGEDHEH